MQLIIRKISQKDQETVVEMLQDISRFKPSIENYKLIFKNFHDQKHVDGYVFLLENEIVGYGAVVYEIKIRGGKVGHIEDIVVSRKFRGKNIGIKIISHLTNVSKVIGCYKVSLVCKESNIKFYQNCGLEVDGSSMSFLF